MTFAEQYEKHAQALKQWVDTTHQALVKHIQEMLAQERSDREHEADEKKRMRAQYVECGDLEDANAFCLATEGAWIAYSHRHDDDRTIYLVAWKEEVSDG